MSKSGELPAMFLIAMLNPYVREAWIARNSGAMFLAFEVSRGPTSHYS
jgi:hypothetical protein